MSKSNIVLTGFMYAGKTTIGRLLSADLEKDFIDTDDIVEEEAGITVPEIFERFGEPHFRETERNAVESVTQKRDLVISLGGGAVLDDRNVRDARRDGIVYYLEVSPESVASRSAGESTRPLLDGRSRAGVAELLSRRSEYYERAADVTISTDDRRPEDIADDIARDFRGRGADPMLQSVETVSVELGERTYNVSIGQGLLGRLEEFLPRHYWKRAAIVTDANVGPLYAATAVSRLRGAGLDTLLLEIPAGEQSKTAEQALELVDSLIAFGLTRSDVVFALGGGVVGDLSGFAASIYKRGIDVVQIPTTVLAQVDSAIGGKTAVNVPAAKNQVGTIHQPVAVIADITLLGTLPFEEFRSGLSEVAKYSVLTGRDWGRAFREDAGTMAGADPARVARVIAECCREKAELVSADERDYGVRHYLNYGHTLGHALEAAAGYGTTYSHGEAVSVGMVYAAIVAEETGTADTGLAKRHRQLLGSLGLPIAPRAPAPPFEEIAVRMSQDKKSTGESVMVLLAEEGRPVIKRGLERDLLSACYDKLNSE